MGDIPEDHERGLPLLEVREPVRGLEDIVLSPGNRSLIEELLREHNREEVLRAHGLRPSDRVLLCGPPGCGKTLTAEERASWSPHPSLGERCSAASQRTTVYFSPRAINFLYLDR